nr:hypothetical protein [Pseudomonas sp.]
MALDSHFYGTDPMVLLERKQERDKKARAEVNMKALFGGNLKDHRIDYRLRIPANLDARLDNWGWLSRDKKRPGISQTGKICHRLALLAGAYKFDDGHAPPSDAQIRDSHLIERAWRNELLPMKQKMLLAGYYVYRVRPEKLCRAASIRYSEFDQHMFTACNMIHNIALHIAQNNDMRDNEPYNSTAGCNSV